MIRNEDFAAYQEHLARDIVDISLVINPEVEVVNSILRVMNAPDVEQINDFVGGRIKMVGKRLPANSPLTGLKLTQLPGRIARNRLIIAALVRDEQLIIPRGKDSLQAGDFVYFVCDQKDLQEILALFGSETSVVKDVLIVGGGKIGLRLAQQLDDRHYNVKLIEMDAQRCQSIAGQLHRTIVLQGYATDQAFMEQENIGSMDILCTDKTGTLTEGVIRLYKALDIHGADSDKGRRDGGHGMRREDLQYVGFREGRRWVGLRAVATVTGAGWKSL